MSWKHTIDISEAFKKAENEEITPAQLSAVVFEELKSLPQDLPDLPVHLGEFEAGSLDPELSDDAFDDLFEGLYDWADQNRVWIATFG